MAERPALTTDVQEDRIAKELAANPGPCSETNPHVVGLSEGQKMELETDGKARVRCRRCHKWMWMQLDPDQVA